VELLSPWKPLTNLSFQGQFTGKPVFEHYSFIRYQKDWTKKGPSLSLIFQLGDPPVQNSLRSDSRTCLNSMNTESSLKHADAERRVEMLSESGSSQCNALLVKLRALYLLYNWHKKTISSISISE
jgi:hypothetical protein